MKTILLAALLSGCSSSQPSRVAGGNEVAGGVVDACSMYPWHPTPVDMYIMFDQSYSMSDPLPDSTTTRWIAAQTGVTNFVRSPAAVGSGVGIQYFPLDGVAPASCRASYSTPDVQIAELPGNAEPLVASIRRHQPMAFTPMAPALAGAIAHMKRWASAHPDRTPVVVLVTDGFPTECQPQEVVDIAGIAAAGAASSPEVLTYVVALQAGLAALGDIAVAGGTGTVSRIEGADVSGQLARTMLLVAGGAPRCAGLPQ